MKDCKDEGSVEELKILFPVISLPIKKAKQDKQKQNIF